MKENKVLSMISPILSSLVTCIYPRKRLNAIQRNYNRFEWAKEGNLGKFLVSRFPRYTHVVGFSSISRDVKEYLRRLVSKLI